MTPPIKPPVKKKPYTPPVLTCYGTVRELTQKVGVQGQRDGLRTNSRTSV